MQTSSPRTFVSKSSAAAAAANAASPLRRSPRRRVSLAPDSPRRLVQIAAENAAAVATPTTLQSPVWSPVQGAPPAAFAVSPVVAERLKQPVPLINSPLRYNKRKQQQQQLLQPSVEDVLNAITSDVPVSAAFDSNGFGIPQPDDQLFSVQWAQWCVWYRGWMASLTSEGNVNMVQRWEALLNVANVRARNENIALFIPGNYELDDGVLMSHYENASQESLWTIAQDIPRTYATHALFLNKSCISDIDSAPALMADLVNTGRKSLHHVLASYANFNPAVGYCQGMSYVVASLLMVMSEEQAFWILVALLESPKHLKDFYEPNLSGLLVMGQMFDRLLQEYLPEANEGVHHLVYVTPWFMRLFTSLESWPVFVSVFDQVVEFGQAALLQAAVGAMHLLKDELLAAPSINQILPVIQQRTAAVVTADSLQQAMALFPMTASKVDSVRKLILLEETAAKTVARKRARDAGHLSTPARKTRSVTLAATPSKSTSSPSLFQRMLGSLTPASAVKPTPSKMRQVLSPSNNPNCDNTNDALGEHVTSPSAFQAFKEFSTPRTTRAHSIASKTPRRTTNATPTPTKSAVKQQTAAPNTPHQELQQSTAAWSTLWSPV